MLASENARSVRRRRMVVMVPPPLSLVTGVIVMNYGTPPGGSRSYRATIFITDPALDARSLNVALLTRSGPAAAETTRAIEDAILSRARQLRIADGAL